MYFNTCKRTLYVLFIHSEVFFVLVVDLLYKCLALDEF